VLVKTIIGTLVASIAAALVTYALTKKAPDVRYSLSDRIPVTFTNQDEVPSESVQQLEVRNVGNEEAHDIQVRINSHITLVKLIKHSERVAPAVYVDRIPFELVYPSLPPDASFAIVFKSAQPVPNSIVTVRHAGGMAKEALAPSNTAWTTIFVWAVVAFNIIMTILSFGDSIESRLRRRLDYKPISGIIVSRKPWYASVARWETALREALIGKVKEYSGYLTVDSLSKSNASVILDLTRPDRLSDAAWTEVAAAASTAYQDAFRRTIKSAGSKIEGIYSIAKPASLTQATWRELQQEARQYHATEITPPAWDRTKILDLLRNPPQALADSDEWSNLSGFLQKELLRLLTHDIIGSPDPIKKLSETELALLKKSDRSEIQQMAYQLQLARYGETIARWGTDEIVANGRPSWMKDADFKVFNDLSRLEQRAEKCIADAEAAKTAAVEEYEKEKGLRQRIEWQLAAIQDVLNDPNAADRVESYADQFAPGNLANLKGASVNRVVREWKAR
jgi:hypothetical protein